METSAVGTERLSVLYADDHELMRDAVGNLISTHPELTLAGTAGNGAELASAYQQLSEAGRRPDLVVTDLSMPEVDGIEACRRICSYDPAAAIVVLSAYTDTERVSAALEAGADSFLLKSSSAHALINAIAHCAHGNTVFAAGTLDTVLVKAAADGQQNAQIAALTPRQREVLSLTEAGLSRAEIGAKLYISPNTVKHHLACINERLGATNAREAAHIVREAGGFVTQPGSGPAT